MKKLDKFLNENFYKIIILFIWCNAFIDVITSLSVRFINFPLTFGAIIRYILMLIVTYYVFVTKKNYKHKKYLSYILFLFTYIFVFVILMISDKNLLVGFFELKYSLKTFYFAILIFNFYILNKEDNDNFLINHRDLVISLGAYIVIILISTMLGTNFASYSNYKMGTNGWFFAANEIGAIMGIMAPLMVYYIIRIKNIFLKTSVLLIYVYANMIIGTKVPFLGTVLSLLFLSIYIIIKTIVKKKRENVYNVVFPILFAFIFIMILYPHTPIGINITNHVNRATIDKVVETEDGFITTKKEVQYDSIIYSGRNTLLLNKQKAYEKASIFEKVMGMGYYELDDEYSAKSIERDIFDIKYAYGFVGFTLMYGFLIISLIAIIYRYFCDFKNNFWNTKKNITIFSLLLGLFISFISGHVLTSPSVSIYLMFLFLFLLFPNKIKMKSSPKIWIDITNSPHAIFFNPIIKELKKENYEVVVTAREYAQTKDLLKMFEIDFVLIGDHKGKSNFKKIWGLFERSWQLYWYIFDKNIDASLSMSSFTAIISSKLLEKPHMTLYDYEYTKGHHISYRFSSIVFTPEGVNKNLLKKYGSNKQNTVFYKGLKEQIYINYYLPDKKTRELRIKKLKKELGIAYSKPIVLFRPEATMAHYQNNVNSLSFQLAKFLNNHKNQPIIIVLPRTLEQKEEYVNLNYKNIIIPSKTLNGIDLICLSDVIIGAGGTVNREAAALGKPVYSIYQGGKMAAVDKMLIKSKKMVYIGSAEEFTKIKVAKNNQTSALPLESTTDFYLNKIKALLTKGESNNL